MHHPGTRQVAGRGLVSYADGDQASAFAQMLGGLIDANVQSRPEKRADFDALSARVGIAVTDIDESVTLDFKGGRLVVSNGLKPDRDITIRGDADTIIRRRRNDPSDCGAVPELIHWVIVYRHDVARQGEPGKE